MSGALLILWAKPVVREDPTAPSGRKVLVQTSTVKMETRFPICVYDGLLTHNVTASVRFKILSQGSSRGAGLVAHYQDAGNYFVAVADVAKGTLQLDKVIDSKLQRVAVADAHVAPQAWHRLSLSLTLHRFTISLDDNPPLAVDDLSLEEAGEVGLWTKSDTVAAFDELTIEESDAGH